MSTLATVQCPILVGRDDVLELADEVIRDVAAGHGRTLLLAGEAGIGKTRMIGAIARRASAAGFPWIQGDLSPQDRDVPMAGLGDMFRSMRTDPATAALGDELLAFRDQAIQDATYSRTLVVGLVERVRAGLPGPTIIVFEDLQWADDISLETIGELARIGDDLPWLIVGAYRRDETPPGTPLRDWRSRLVTQRRAQEVRLERLTLEETATMTTLLLGTGLPASRDVVHAVHTRSDGLPLHIEELIAVARANGPVDVGAVLGASVPDSIEDAVLARAARRSADAQAVARAGAVMGRCFDPAVLAGVMDRPVAELDDALQELVDHGFLCEIGTVDAGYYDFRHQLLRDALYRSAPEAERRRYHARAGEFGKALEGASEIHASLHYERAGLREQAYRAARAGAEAAARVSAHREAFELYRRAVRNVPDGLPDLERAELLDRFATEAAAIEENELSEEMAWAARESYLAADHPLEAAVTISEIHSLWRRMGRALSARAALIDKAIAEVEAVPPSRNETPSLVSWQTTAWSSMWIRSIWRPRADDGTALRSLVAAAGDEDGLVQAINARLAMVDILSGDPDRGLAAMARVAEAAKDDGDEESSVTAYRDAAVFAARVMAYARAEEYLGEGLRYADSIQQSHCAHVMAATVAEVDWAAGRWDAALPAGQQAIADRGCRRAPAMARWAIGYRRPRARRVRPGARAPRRVAAVRRGERDARVEPAARLGARRGRGPRR